MVWIKVKKYTRSEEEHFSKRAIKKQTKPMFMAPGHTREAKVEMSQKAKHTIVKKLTPAQYGVYNRILEEQREREERFVKKRELKKKKKNAVTKKE